MTTRRFLLCLGVVAAVGLGLRLGVCLELYRLPSVQTPWKGTDMATYRRIALEVRDGTCPERFYYQPFYYAVFLPAVHLLTGRSVRGVLLIQALLGTATVWLTGLVGARLFGRRSGLIAAALLALARMPVFYTPFLLIATLQSFWMALLAYVALLAWQKRSASYWIGLALVSSAAILTRGNVLLLVPCFLALGVWRLRDTPAKAVAAVVLFAVVCYLPQLPFALRNLQHYGRWTGPSSAQDAVLALGNTPEAPPGGLEYPTSYREWMRKADLPGDDRIPVSRQVLRWVLREPLVFAELKFRTLLLFWHRLEVPNNVALEAEGRHSRLLRAPALLPFSLLGTLSVFGLLVCWRRRSPQRLLLYYCTGMYCAATVLFYVLARFRVPLIPLLCVFAAAGCTETWRRLRRKGSPERLRTTRLLHLLAAVSAVFLVWGGFSTYQLLCEDSVMRLLRPNGVCVYTPEAIVQHDHGPFGVGGMRFVALPAGGMQIDKVFAAVPIDPQAVEGATLRVPIKAAPGARFEMRVVVASGGPVAADQVSVEKGQGYDVAVVRLPDVRPDDSAPRVLVDVLPVGGDVLLAVDTQRDYDRTAVLGRDGTLLLVDVEAAFELHWQRNRL